MIRYKQILLATVAATFFTSAAFAAGPLYLWEGGDEVRPYTWDTSNGPIPVYTDGGEAFTFDFDGVTPFLTIERANEITAFAFDQWNNVPTSTFEAKIAGTIESVTGISDVTGANANQIYGVENGYGFFVNYDTDGDILEDFFGVPRRAVLGIAFPEWADEETGEITEATIVINGWNVSVGDPNGDMVAGVFTHEFGHAINLSHSQTNGYMVYFGSSFREAVAGPTGCDLPRHYRYDTPPFRVPLGGVLTDSETIEIMFPLIDHIGGAGADQAVMSVKDDAVSISNLYPTAEYKSSTGSIAGKLLLKDGRTEYSGINIIARNVDDPYFDAVSVQSGNQTQGLIGPDGSFVINGLTPGAQYEVYTEQIIVGGYPTTPTRLVSVAEYWNASEAANPVSDDACQSTPISVSAGQEQSADLIFNGYKDGIQYRPIVDAFLTDLAKNGRSAAGLIQSVAFHWDLNAFLQDQKHPQKADDYGFRVLPPELKANNGAVSRTGDFMTVQYDDNGNGIGQAALFDFTGKTNKGDVIVLGDLNGDSCGGGGQSGVNSSYGWDVDDAAKTAVGTAYLDTDGDGFCQTSRKGEIVPFIWTKEKNGGEMRQLSMEGAPNSFSWVRAHAVSGNGRVVLGSNGGSKAVAWVDEGELINLADLHDAREAYASSMDGSKVALATGFQSKSTVRMWNPYTGETQDIESLRWCRDAPYNSFFGGDLCERFGEDLIFEVEGYIPVLPFDMNDDGTVIVGRGGSFFTGFVGAIWIEGLGWMTLKDFFAKQGVTEAQSLPMDNPFSLDGNGDMLVGGIAGASSSWHVDMREVFVCKNGTSVATGFPEGLMSHIANGAEFGRCEHLD